MEIFDFKILREESSMECMRISSYSISAQELHHFTYHNHHPGNMYGTFLNSQQQLPPSYQLRLKEGQRGEQGASPKH